MGEETRFGTDYQNPLEYGETQTHLQAKVLSEKKKPDGKRIRAGDFSLGQQISNI